MTDKPAELSFVLSASSLAKLEGVKPELVEVVKFAVSVTAIDFCVLEGLRTIERQRLLVAKGASKTLNSRHLTGHAVDLGALIDAQVTWHWPLYYVLADAMRAASIAMGTPVTWGGCWDRRLAELPPGPEAIGKAVAEYAARVRSTGKAPFLDGPHYQIEVSK